MQVKYFVIKGKKDPVSIYVRFSVGRKFDRKTKTGLSIPFEYFSNAKQRVKQRAEIRTKDAINNTLSELEGYILDKWTDEVIAKSYIPEKWLRNTVDEYFGRVVNNKGYKVYFLDWIQKYIEDSPKRLFRGQPLKYKRIQQYKTVMIKVQNYQSYKNTRLKFEDINLNFYNNFVRYCKDIEKLNNNTLGGYLSIIKMWCKNIDIDGYPINPQYKHSEFTTMSNKTQDIYLNETEIEKIYNYRFDSLRLDNVRDLFVIGLRTGLRVSDFMRLKNVNIESDLITIETEKTGETVIIPLHPQIKSILTKRNGKFPKTISKQKFNEYIKEICQIVGFTDEVEGAKMVRLDDGKYRKVAGVYPKYELVTSHICRRSFATNLYGKLPNSVIMSITGHKTESVFLKYIKTTKKENAETLQRYWNGEKIKQPINLKIAK